MEWDRGCLADQALHFRVFVRSVVAAGQRQGFLFRACAGQSGAEIPLLAMPVSWPAVRGHRSSQRFHGKITCSRLKVQKRGGLNPNDSSPEFKGRIQTSRAREFNI